jgi:hypothetical protein
MVRTSLIGRVVAADESFIAGPYFTNPLSLEHNLQVAKPWKCRLGLQDWEVRENPETQDHYDVSAL